MEQKCEALVMENKRLRSTQLIAADGTMKSRIGNCSVKCIMVGLRRSSAGCSLKALSQLLDKAVCPNTVRSYELRTASCVILEAAEFHDVQIDLLKTVSNFGVVAHRVRADATNTCAYRGCSLQTCECASYFIYDGSTSATLTVWPDAQVVRGKTTEDTYALTKKQCEVVRCPVFGPALTQIDGKVLERWCCYISDDGTDQKGVRRQLDKEQASLQYEYFVGLVCMAHAVSNGAKKTMVLTDALAVHLWKLPTYFSSIAKLSNVLRHHFHNISGAWRSTRPGDPDNKNISASRIPNRLPHVGGAPPTRRLT